MSTDHKFIPRPEGAQVRGATGAKPPTPPAVTPEATEPIPQAPAVTEQLRVVEVPRFGLLLGPAAASDNVPSQPTLRVAQGVPQLGLGALTALLAAAPVVPDIRLTTAVRLRVNGFVFLFQSGSVDENVLAQLGEVEITSTTDISRGAVLLRRLQTLRPLQGMTESDDSKLDNPEQQWLSEVDAIDTAYAEKVHAFLQAGGKEQFLALRQFS